MLVCIGSICCSIRRRTNSSTRRSISRSTSDEGTSKVTRDGELLQQVGARFAFGLVPRLVLEIGAHPGAQRIERLELAEVLGELVVECRDDALADGLDRDVVLTVVPASSVTV